MWWIEIGHGAQRLESSIRMFMLVIHRHLSHYMAKPADEQWLSSTTVSRAQFAYSWCNDCALATWQQSVSSSWDYPSAPQEDDITPTRRPRFTVVYFTGSKSHLSLKIFKLPTIFCNCQIITVASLRVGSLSILMYCVFYSIVICFCAQLKPVEFLLGSTSRLGDVIVLGMLTQLKEVICTL